MPARSASGLVSAVLAIGLIAPPAARLLVSQEPPVFTTEVNLVAVPVFVTDKAGRAVAGLIAADFELEDQGKKVPLVAFLAMFIGDKGTILCGFTGTNPRILPEAKMKAYKQPPKSLPRSPGNDREWLDACKGGKPGGANFGFSGPVTEALLLGNVALRSGEKLLWDAANLKVSNVASANHGQL